MFAIPVSKVPRPVAVLLGGSGYARPSLSIPTVPALLKPLPAVPGRAGNASEPHAAGG